jgi:hypothetical protein
MSTPIPPNCKLEGLDLYAPRYARAQPAPESEDTPQQPSPHEPQQDQRSESQAAAATHAQIDAALRTLIDAGRPCRDAPTLAPAAPPPMPPMPRAANLPSSHSEPAERPPSAPDSPRPAQRLVQTRARHRSRLDPEIVPEPPLGAQRRTVLPLLVRLVLVAGFAATAAYGLTIVSSLQPGHWPTGASGAMTTIAKPDREAVMKPLPPSRLVVVKNRQAFANEPLPLEISVADATGQESLLLAGLMAGTRLSAGVRVSKSGWQLPSRDLNDVFVYAPKDFIGVMNTAVDLISPTKQLMDSRAVQLEWIAKKVEPPKPADRIDSAIPSPAPVQPMDPDEASLLMKRGENLLQTGDIAAARLAFRPLADAGIADGALALAATFDPVYLAERGVIGVAGDEAKARAWYRRALELGSTEAGRILARMATK